MKNIITILLLLFIFFTFSCERIEQGTIIKIKADYNITEGIMIDKEFYPSHIEYDFFACKGCNQWKTIPDKYEAKIQYKDELINQTLDNTVTIPSILYEKPIGTFISLKENNPKYILIIEGFTSKHEKQYASIGIAKEHIKNFKIGDIIIINKVNDFALFINYSPWTY